MCKKNTSWTQTMNTNSTNSNVGFDVLLLCVICVCSRGLPKLNSSAVSSSFSTYHCGLSVAHWYCSVAHRIPEIDSSTTIIITVRVLGSASTVSHLYNLQYYCLYYLYARLSDYYVVAALCE